MRICLIVFVAVLLAGSVVRGQDKAEKAKPDTPEQAADKVLATFKAKDEKGLKALAAKDNPDPWLVADELCFRGEHDAAEAFAKAAPRKDTEKLPVYVASQRGKPNNAAARRALAAATKALAAKDPKAALAAIEAADAKSADSVSVQLLHRRGYVLRYLRRLEDSARVFLAAANAAERLGWLALAASALRESGDSAFDRSDWRGALQAWERLLALDESRENRFGAARTLNNSGLIYKSLGDYAKALEYYKRALKTMEELGDRARVAAILGNIGVIHDVLGDYTKALDYQQRSLKLKEELGNRGGVATSLGNIGNVYFRLHDYAKALDYQQRSLKLKEELGDRAGVASSLGNIGIIHRGLGDYTKALDYLERARVQATELRLLDVEVWGLWQLAKTQHVLGEPTAAVGAARSGVAKLSALVGLLAEEQGATARGRWAGLLATGVRAGMQLVDAAEVSFFLESGRAGSLLESLGGRAALGRVAVPKELEREEKFARTSVLGARARHDRALRAGKREETRAARASLEAARGKLLDVVAKIQREAKAAANVVYPKADPLKEIRATLAGNEALVLYALLSEEAVALVVKRDGARTVSLGKTATIETACAALASGADRANARGIKAKKTPRSDPAAEARKLRELVFVPLGLDRSVKRLLISPHRALAAVPFALLAGDAEVAYVASGTTYGVLLDESEKRGREVLALGDPDYGVEPDPHALAILTRDDKLSRLPGTRIEAKAVGDTLLLDRDASGAGLRKALASGKRWRAVHLACHGLVRADQPMLSSLALTPDAESSGFLTVLDVFRMKIPADLVVLSACQTGRGKVYKSEGIVGMTRAFMFAGAPRVIVSLWKVDDEATRALMVKFYELWNPKDGSKGLPTATALKQAQEYVASHEKWKHPYYWAAWQLWGLPD